jgi:hypothetical protein
MEQHKANLSQKQTYTEPSLDQRESLAEVAEGPGVALSTGGGGVPIEVP